MSQIFRSVIIISIISSLLALIFQNFGFWRVFAVVTGFQFCMYYLYSAVMRVIAMQNANAELEEILKQSALVTCPCPDQEEAIVPISITGNNNYNCTKCGKGVGIKINVSTALETDMVDNDISHKQMIDKFDELVAEAEERSTTTTEDDMEILATRKGIEVDE